MIILTLIVGCRSKIDVSEKRAKRAFESKGDIVVAIVDSSVTPTMFVEGVKLAIEDINSSGGVLGRKIKPLFYDDEGKFETGQKIAHKIAGKDDVIAVIGHRFSEVAVPVSITYEKNGILFISTGATDQDLIRDTAVFTVRNISSDEDFGRESAAFAKRKNFKKIAILFDSESSGKRIADLFHEQADRIGIKIVAEKAYSKYQDDFRYLISDLTKQAKFDAIFLGGMLPSAAIMIKQLRNLGVDVPIIGTERMDAPELLNIAGKAANDTIVTTVFDPRLSEKNTIYFTSTFKEKNGVEPDAWAAQGYDAISLLAFAIDKSGSTVPIALSSTLKLLKKWKSVSGSYSFNQNGSISGKNIFFKIIKNSNFAVLERELRQNINPFEVIKDITIRIPIEGAVETVDPTFVQDMISIDLSEQLFLGLTDFNPKNYEAYPELATKWIVSEDGKTYRFEMRKDVLWTDGTPVTAHDIVWAIQRNIKPETNCPSVSMLYVLKNAKAINKKEMTEISKLGVKADGDYAVEFILENPASYFPAMAGLWVYRPLPRKIIEKYQQDWTDPKNIVTNGSYRLASLEKEMLVILRKNELYYDANQVKIPEVRYYVIPDGSIGLSMYKNDQLDIMGGNYLTIPPSEISNLNANPALASELYQVPQFCTYAYGFNTKLPPMDNPLVRKAISAAIDRSLLCEVLYRGNQEPATTFTRPPIFGSVDPRDGIGIHFDLKLAKKWLAEAGFPDGKGFPEIKLLYNSSPKHEMVAKAIQTLLDYSLNIKVNIIPKEWSEYTEGMKQPNTNYHMFRFGWCNDYPDANNSLNELFNPKSSNNNIGWENKEFTDLMERAQKETIPEDRKKTYKRAEQILCEEVCAMMPLFFEVHNFLVKSRVKGWYNLALGGQHIRDWYFEE
ncbi:MAG: ABC transporter substrate-binding protein [Desulfobacterales bacterium]|nr:ABC transporter substrate-binding protein [Desulfobacterales bacterium]